MISRSVMEPSNLTGAMNPLTCGSDSRNAFGTGNLLCRSFRRKWPAIIALISGGLIDLRGRDDASKDESVVIRAKSL